MNADQSKDINQLKRIYAIINGINKAIIRINEKDTLMQEICNVIKQKGGIYWHGLAY